MITVVDVSSFQLRLRIIRNAAKACKLLFVWQRNMGKLI